MGPVMQIQLVKNGNTLLCGNYVSTTSERNCLSQLLMFHTALMTATDLRALAGLTYYFKRPSTHLYFTHARTHTPTTQYQHHLLPIDYMNTVCVCMYYEIFTTNISLFCMIWASFSQEPSCINRSKPVNTLM